MSLIDSKGSLSRAAKDLFARWEEVKGVWSDTKSKEFEEMYIIQIEQDVRTALSAMDHMNQVLQTIENACG